MGIFSAKPVFQLFPGSPQNRPGWDSDRKKHFYKILSGFTSPKGLENTDESSKTSISACVTHGQNGHWGCRTRHGSVPAGEPKLPVLSSLCSHHRCWGRSSSSPSRSVWPEEMFVSRSSRGQCRNLRLARAVYATRSRLVRVLRAKHNSEKQGPPKVSSSNLSSPHCAQPYIFSNDMPRVESPQLEETCSSIFWGQFFMTET